MTTKLANPIPRWRGFNLLDSGRSDVIYEDWHGHRLDRKLLDLLKTR